MERLRSVNRQSGKFALVSFEGLVGDTVKTVTPVADQLGQEAWKRFNQLVGEDYAYPKDRKNFVRFEKSCRQMSSKHLSTR